MIEFKLAASIPSLTKCCIFFNFMFCACKLYDSYHIRPHFLTIKKLSIHVSEKFRIFCPSWVRIYRWARSVLGTVL